MHVPPLECQSKPIWKENPADGAGDVVNYGMDTTEGQR